MNSPTTIIHSAEPIMLIRIPTRHELDPVRKYWGDYGQQTRSRGQADLDPKQTPKIASHLKLPDDVGAPARHRQVWVACPTSST